MAQTEALAEQPGCAIDFDGIELPPLRRSERLRPYEVLSFLDQLWHNAHQQGAVTGLDDMSPLTGRFTVPASADGSMPQIIAQIAYDRGDYVGGNPSVAYDFVTPSLQTGEAIPLVCFVHQKYLDRPEILSFSAVGKEFEDILMTNMSAAALRRLGRTAAALRTILQR